MCLIHMFRIYPYLEIWILSYKGDHLNFFKLLAVNEDCSDWKKELRTLQNINKGIF